MPDVRIGSMAGGTPLTPFGPGRDVSSREQPASPVLENRRFLGNANKRPSFRTEAVIEGFPWRFPFQSRHRVLNTVSDRPKSAPDEVNWPFRRKSRPPSNNWSRFGWRPRTWRTSRSTCPRQAPALATFSRLRFRSRRNRGRGLAPSPLWRPDAGERRPARRIAGGEAFLQAFVDLPIGRLRIRCRPPVPAARDRRVRADRCAPLRHHGTRRGSERAIRAVAERQDDPVGTPRRSMRCRTRG
jgi:hypothetical protein